MKILYHHRIGSKDGQYVHIEEMVEALRAAGHEVRTVGPEGFDDREFGGESGMVSRLKQHIPGALYEVMELAYNGVDYRRLAAAVDEFAPDVIYERYNLALLSGVALARRRGIPLLLEVNAPLYAERSAYGGLQLAAMARWSEQRAWRAADHVFAVTDVLADHLRRAGVPESRLSITPNGINPLRFQRIDDTAGYKKRLGLDGRTVLGFTGFAREWHGLDRVIALLAEDGGVHDLHFLLVGDGPACPGLQRQARALGVADRVTITGIVARDDIQARVAAFDIALLPGVVAYASPLKLFEYMACGKTIAAPRQANIQEILTDDHDAALFDPQHDEGLIDTVRALIDDAPRRTRLAEAAHRTLVDRELTWAANARHAVEVARGLVAVRRAG